MITEAVRNLFEPLGFEHFAEQYGDRQATHCSPGRSERFAHLFSLTAAEEVLSTHPQRWQVDTNLANARRQPTLEELQQLVPSMAKVKVGRLGQAFSRGNTLIINGAQLFHPPLAAFARELDAAFHFRVQINVYISPPGAQGFPPHFDTHDVLVLQLAGAKQWYCYDRVVPHALEGQTRNLLPQEVGAETSRPLLAPGDMLYLPRGLTHNAETTEDLSIHLTVGLHPVTWQHLAERALDGAAARWSEFRQSVPLGSLLDRSRNAELQQATAAWLRRLADEAEQQGTLPDLDAARVAFVAERAQLLPGALAAAAADTVTVDTLVQVRPGTSLAYRRDRAFAFLHYPGDVLRGPARIASACAWLADFDGSPFTAGSLPDLSAKSSLVLVRRLMKDGVLACV